MNDDELLKRSENATDPRIINRANRLRLIISNAKLYSPTEYENAKLELDAALRNDFVEFGM